MRVCVGTVSRAHAMRHRAAPPDSSFDGVLAIWVLGSLCTTVALALKANGLLLLLIIIMVSAIK